MTGQEIFDCARVLLDEWMLGYKKPLIWLVIAVIVLILEYIGGRVFNKDYQIWDRL